MVLSTEANRLSNNEIHLDQSLFETAVPNSTINSHYLNHIEFPLAYIHDSRGQANLHLINLIPRCSGQHLRIYFQ